MLNPIDKNSSFWFCSNDESVRFDRAEITLFRTNFRQILLIVTTIMRRQNRKICQVAMNQQTNDCKRMYALICKNDILIVGFCVVNATKYQQQQSMLSFDSCNTQLVGKVLFRCWLYLKTIEYFDQKSQVHEMIIMYMILW